MTDKYSEKAAELQRGVRSDEVDQYLNGQAEFSEGQARQAAVHTREDLVMVVSHLSSLNIQIGTIRRLLWAVVALLVILLLE